MTSQSDTARLYEALAALARNTGGTRTLAECTGRSCRWPARGVYFFFEGGEHRRDGVSPRVVRVGTHALTPTSKTSLWTRLGQHRGHLAGQNAGGGNHRTSIFRLHVGAALSRRLGYEARVLESWLAKHPLSDCIAAERDLEREVSRHIGAMPFLVVSVPSRAEGTSDRSHLERNSIALLSSAAMGVDPASEVWLGRLANNPMVVRSGLWNVKHVEETYDPRFLDALESYVSSTTIR